MAKFDTTILSNDDRFELAFSETNVASLADAVNEFLGKEGYKIIDGGKENATYEKGSRVMRILFGAFVKYYKFGVHVFEKDGKTQVTISKASSGMSGGLIGIKQMKTELHRLEQGMMLMN